MTIRRLSRAAALLLALPLAAGVLAAATPAAKPVAKPAPKAAAPLWSAKVTTTPIGAYQIGNPAAKVHVVEYISYTCSHCANFVRSSSAPLKSGYVDSGRVRVEIRNAARDPLDLTAALLARCDGPSKFLGHHVALLTAQPTWMGTVQKQSDATIDAWNQGPLEARLKKIATGSGLAAIMKARGLTQPRIDACLSDAQARSAIESMTNFAWNVEKIGGTPAFLVNSRKTDALDDWPALKLIIDRALAAS